jgi:HEAT repeat protein
VPLTHQTALEALAEVPGAADHDRICNIFTSDRDSGVRNAAARVLVAMASPDNWRRSFDLLAGDRMPRHRQWACGLAGHFGGVPDIDGLGTLLNDGDGHVRRSAGKAHNALAAKAAQMPAAAPVAG